MKNPTFLSYFVLAFVLYLMSGSYAEASPPLNVIASFSVVGDMAQQIGGDHVRITTLVGGDADTHNYQPTTDDVRKLATADLVILNGLGFEGWMPRLIESSGTKGTVVIASDGITPIKGDPHAWQNVANGRIYARNIAKALEKALPDAATDIQQHADAYDSKLAELDTYIRNEIQSVPESKRIIITSHDAFGYFGAAYGVIFYAPEGLSPDAEPSAASVAHLLDQIKTLGIKTIFLENMTSPKLIQQIARDTDVKLGGMLYSDALSLPNGDAPTYIAMFHNNIVKLKAAMLENR